MLYVRRRLFADFRRLIVAYETDNTVVADSGFVERALRGFWWFMARYHGISIFGGDMLSSMAFMPSTSYDRIVKETRTCQADCEFSRVGVRSCFRPSC